MNYANADRARIEDYLGYSIQCHLDRFVALNESLFLLAGLPASLRTNTPTEAGGGVPPGGLGLSPFPLSDRKKQKGSYVKNLDA